MLMLFKAYLGKKPNCLPALPVPWLGVRSFLGEQEQPCMEVVNAPQVHTAAKWHFCLYFLITNSFFFCCLDCSDHPTDVTYTWLISHEGFASECQWSAQIPSCHTWSWDWVIFATMSNFTVTYTNVISCFVTQPLSLTIPCAFHQSQPSLLMPWLT